MTLETDKTRAITNAEIERDILETEQEIALMDGEATALELTPMGSPDAKLAHFRASARRSGIAERQAFVAKLRALLAERSEPVQ